MPQDVRCFSCSSQDFLLLGWAWEDEAAQVAATTALERVQYYRRIKRGHEEDEIIMLEEKEAREAAAREEHHQSGPSVWC